MNLLIIICVNFSVSMLAVVRISDPVTYCEALVYCVGTLKLLSGNAQLQKELGERGCVEALSELIASINTVRGKVEDALCCV